MNRWTTKNKTDLLKTPVFSLSKLTCSLERRAIEHEFYVLHTADWINIVAITTDGRFIMVRQHRLGTDEITWETPAGMIDRHESPERAAERELEEETGYRANKIIPLKKLASNPAIMSNYIHFYLAIDCEPAGPQRLDETEDIDIVLMDRDELGANIQNGSIDHSIALLAVSLYFLSPYAGQPPAYYPPA